MAKKQQRWAGLVEAFYDPDGSFDNGTFGGPIGKHRDHVHFSINDPKGMLAAIKLAQSMGMHVGENPYVDKVDPVHVPDSYHYRTFPGTFNGKQLGMAIDVSGTPEQMDAIYKRVTSGAAIDVPAPQTQTQSNDPHTLADTFAARLATATGLDGRVIRAWAEVEGAYAPNGTGHFNFLNVRPAPGGQSYSGVQLAGISSGNFQQFSSLDDAVAETAYWINHFANYKGIRASIGKSYDTQIMAIAQSPWDQARYQGGGPIFDAYKRVAMPQDYGGNPVGGIPSTPSTPSLPQPQEILQPSYEPRVNLSDVSAPMEGNVLSGTVVQGNALFGNTTDSQYDYGARSKMIQDVWGVIGSQQDASPFSQRYAGYS